MTQEQENNIYNHFSGTSSTQLSMILPFLITVQIPCTATNATVDGERKRKEWEQLDYFSTMDSTKPTRLEAHGS